jgi:hypothetical protein
LARIDRKTRDEAVHPGYVELKRWADDHHGLVFYPEFEMLYFDEWDNCRSVGAVEMQTKLSAINALDRVTMLAIHHRNRDFHNFISTLKFYKSLELLFVVVGQVDYMREPNWVKLGGSEDGVMFEYLDRPAARDELGPFYSGPSRMSIEYSMSREVELDGGDSEWIMPHFQFVRAIKKLIV